ncbi:MAG: hypothetical protein ACLPKT_23020 [Methylocella sp.]
MAKTLLSRANEQDGVVMANKVKEDWIHRFSFHVFLAPANRALEKATRQCVGVAESLMEGNSASEFAAERG